MPLLPSTDHDEAANAIKLIKVDTEQQKERLVDLRSDTVTLPTVEMRKAAYNVCFPCHIVYMFFALTSQPYEPTILHAFPCHPDAAAEAKFHSI